MIKHLYNFIFVILLTLSFSTHSHAQSAFDDPDQVIPPSERAERLGDLVAVQTDVQAGDVTSGASSQVVVLFRNDSNNDVTFQDVNLYPSSNITASVFNNICAREPVTPGAECAIVLSIRGGNIGPYRLSILARHSGIKKLVSATVTGLVTATVEEQNNAQILSDIEVIPSEVDFGTLSLSRPIIRSVTIKNISTEELDVQNVSIDSAPQSGYSMRHNCEKLQPAEACIANITWSPLIEGPASGFLVVDHSGPGRVANVSLTGSYSADSAEAADVFPNAIPGKGLLISNITEFEFGSGIAAASALTATLVNAGDSPLRFLDISLAGLENGLTLTNTSCRSGLTIQPSEACALTLRWSPIRSGDIVDTVLVKHDGARGIFAMPVSGNAESAVNADSRSLVSGDSGRGISISESEDDDDLNSISFDSQNGITPPSRPSSYGDSSNIPIQQKAPVLDSFVITSHSEKNAVLTGPGGSRIVSDGKVAVLGGYKWLIDITEDGVSFISGKDSILLLFDRSFPSPNSDQSAREEATSVEASSTDDDDEF